MLSSINSTVSQPLQLVDVSLERRSSGPEGDLYGRWEKRSMLIKAEASSINDESYTGGFGLPSHHSHVYLDGPAAARMWNTTIGHVVSQPFQDAIRAAIGPDDKPWTPELTVRVTYADASGHRLLTSIVVDANQAPEPIRDLEDAVGFLAPANS
jgi:hypothetical protein